MRERAAAIGATVEFASQPGNGTAVVIERPTPGEVVTAAGTEPATNYDVEAAGRADVDDPPGRGDDAGVVAVVTAPRRALRRVRGGSGRAARPPSDGAQPRPGDGAATDGAEASAESVGANGASAGQTAAATAPAREGHQP
jgi:hypothetical protein